MWVLVGECYVLMSVSIMLLVGSMIKEREKVVGIVGLILLISSLMVIEGEGGVRVFEGSIEGSSVIKTGKLMAVVVGGLSMLEGLRKGLERKWEYGILVMFNVLGVVLIITSKDMITLYVGIEVQSLVNYVLVGFRRKSAYSTEASLKYFIIGSVGSGLVLMGISMCYKMTGSVVLEEIGRVLSMGLEEESVKISKILILLGLGMKLSAGPLHQWYIDVVEGSEVRSARIISVLPKIGGLCALVKLIVVFGVESEILGILCIGSMLVSVVGGYYQRKIRRFIGYSSVGHIGYMLIVLNNMTEKTGGESLLMYLGLYSLMTIGIWSIVESTRVNFIEELGSVCRRNRSLGGGILVLCLSMAGIPPLGGFYVKLELLIEGLMQGSSVLVGLAVLCTVLGGFNYLRWLKVVYYDKTRPMENVVEVQVLTKERSMLLASIIGIVLVYVVIL